MGRRSNGVVTEKAHLRGDKEKFDAGWDRIFGRDKKDESEKSEKSSRESEDGLSSDNDNSQEGSPDSN